MDGNVDLAQTFKVDEPGRYGVRVRHREYITHVVLDADGREIRRERRMKVDVTSEMEEIIVKPPDPEAVGKIDSLLRSGKDEDVGPAIALLGTAAAGVCRKELPSLWDVVRTRQGTVKNHALKVFLRRIDLADYRVSDDELFAEVKGASTDQDKSLRMAAAQSVCRMRDLGLRGVTVDRFIAQRFPTWFDGETSSDCRAVLVRRLPVPKAERLVAIVLQDADPKVRVAAIQRLVELDPHRFQEFAEAFTNLAGQVTVEGRSLSLGAFVEGEKDRVRRTLRDGQGPHN
jgi:hypothetical protein